MQAKDINLRKFLQYVSESLDKNAFESLEKEFDKLVGKYYSQRKLNFCIGKN